MLTLIFFDRESVIGPGKLQNIVKMAVVMEQIEIVHSYNSHKKHRFVRFFVFQLECDLL